MTNQDIFNILVRGMFASSARPAKQDPDCWEIGQHSVWQDEDGKWLVGRNWSSYSRDSGWDGGCDELPADEGGGPHQAFETAVVAALRAEFEYQLGNATAELGEAQLYDLEQVEEIMVA